MSRPLALALVCGLALLAGADGARGAIDPDLVFHLKLDESSGTAAADATGHGHNATVIKGSGSPVWVAGKRAGALRLAGLSATTSRYVDVPWDASLGITGAITILAWVKLDQTPNQAQTIAGRGSGSSDWAFCVDRNANHLNFDLRTSTRSYSMSESTHGRLSEGTWYHLAATYNGSTMRLYLDGNLLGSSAATGQIQYGGVASVPLAVGARATAAGTRTDPVLGSLDEVKLWKRALTAAEIAADMAGGQIRRLRWVEKF